MQCLNPQSTKTKIGKNTPKNFENSDFSVLYKTIAKYTRVPQKIDLTSTSIELKNPE